MGVTLNRSFLVGFVIGLGVLWGVIPLLWWWNEIWNLIVGAAVLSSILLPVLIGVTATLISQWLGGKARRRSQRRLLLGEMLSELNVIRERLKEIRSAFLATRPPKPFLQDLNLLFFTTTATDRTRLLLLSEKQIWSRFKAFHSDLDHLQKFVALYRQCNHTRESKNEGGWDRLWLERRDEAVGLVDTLMAGLNQTTKVLADKGAKTAPFDQIVEVDAMAVRAS